MNNSNERETAQVEVQVEQKLRLPQSEFTMPITITDFCGSLIGPLFHEIFSDYEGSYLLTENGHIFLLAYFKEPAKVDPNDKRIRCFKKTNAKEAITNDLRSNLVKGYQVAKRNRIYELTEEGKVALSKFYHVALPEVFGTNNLQKALANAANNGDIAKATDKSVDWNSTVFEETRDIVVGYTRTQEVVCKVCGFDLSKICNELFDYKSCVNGAPLAYQFEEVQVAGPAYSAMQPNNIYVNKIINIKGIDLEYFKQLGVSTGVAPNVYSNPIIAPQANYTGGFVAPHKR